MEITVIIPTYNEEKYLKKALYSVSFADQIIVIDSFSTDQTVAIATDFGCEVIQRKFDNFSNQKNAAIQLAKGKWILFMDADERITKVLRNEILAAIRNNTFGGFKLKFPHFFMNRFLYNKVDKVVRLVKNNGVYFSGEVHEKLHVKGEIGVLQHPVLHFTYKGLNHYLAKKNNYAWFQASMMLQKNKKVTYFHLAFKPFWRFFQTYILKKAFLDGVPGLAVSILDAYGVMSRYAKLLILQKGLK